MLLLLLLLLTFVWIAGKSCHTVGHLGTIIMGDLVVGLVEMSIESRRFTCHSETVPFGKQFDVSINLTCEANQQAIRKRWKGTCILNMCLSA